MDAKELIKLYEKMKTDRSPWDTMWQEIANYIFPRKSNIARNQSSGQKQTLYLYDGTAVKANEDLAAWLQSNLTSMAMDWFTLRIGNEGAEEVDKEGEIWLEGCRDILFDFLRTSNFSGQIHECYLDLGAFCNTAIFIEELKEKGKFQGLHFVTLQPGEYCIEEGPDGKVKALPRVFLLSAQVAYEKWGDKLSDKILKAKDKEPALQFEFLHFVYPQDWYGGSNKTRLPYVSVYIDMEGKKILETKGFEEFPFAVFPWMKASGEKYGRGPGWTALPDVKTLNKAVENTLKQWALVINPPAGILQNGLIGALVLTPGGRFYVRTHDAVKPYETGAKFDVDKVNRQELETKIKEYFHGDKIRMLPPPEEAGKMTAFEVSIRYEMAQKLLGPTFNYIVNQGLDVIIERSFNILYRAGQFPPPPESIRRASQAGQDKINISYESPLARAQRMHEVEAMTKIISFVAPLSEQHPELWDNIDLDEGIKQAARIMGLPKKMIRGKEDIQKMRDARAQVQAQQRQAEEMERQAKVLSKGVPALKDIGPEAVGKMAEMAGRTG